MAATRILVVEDEPHIAQDIQAKLEDCGYRIVGIAASGAAALHAINKQRPDLVLMDIVLDGSMDGIDTAQQIHDAHNIPIIFLTAHAEEDRLQRAKITDPFGYVLKPVHARELHAAIMLALHKAESVRQLQRVVWTNAALMSICDAVITFDLEGRLSDINASAASMLRCSQAEVKGLTIECLAKLSDRSDGASLSEIIASVAATGEAFRCERDAMLEVAGGVRIPVHFSVSPILDPKKNLLGAVCVIHDDSERWQAELKLQDSEQQMAAIINNTSAVIYIKDLAGRHLLVNQQYERILGLSKQDILTKTTHDLFPQEMADKMCANDLEASTASGPIQYEEQAQQLDGIHDYISVKMPLHDVTGEVYAICGISTDITEQKRKEHGLTKIANCVQRLLAATTDEQAFYRITCEGIIDLVNADISALPILDLSGDRFTYRAAVGKHADLLMGKTMPVEGGGLCGWVAKHGQTLRVPDLFTDARVLPDLARALEVNSALVTPLLHDTIVIGGLTAFRSGESFDVIEQELLAVFSQRVGLAFGNQRLLLTLEQRVTERTQELEASNTELEAFSYSVSHDLRAPLRSINGFSKALLEDYASILDGQGRDYLQRIGSSAVRMGQLIDDLLMLSRVSRGEMQHQPVDLSALATSVAKNLSERFPQRQVELCITPGLATLGDARLLHIALSNLFDNAWKFTGKQAQAQITFGTEQHAGKTAYFVRDNGAGFDMTYADKLFRPFQRLHAEQEFEGTGIGLATVRRVIQRHGGKTWAEGTPGAGATIYFTL